MAGLVDEISDITDFYLVDYGTAYKTMTVDEALLGPVLAHGGGDYVKLSEEPVERATGRRAARVAPSTHEGP
jgi:hypothetical protein